MLIKHLKFLSILFLFFLVISCQTKTSSEGDFDHIIVFADSTLYQDVAPVMDQIFDKFIYTPHSERSFLTKLAPLNLLDVYKERRNIIFIGLLNQSDKVSEYVKNLLAPAVKTRIENNEVFEIFREDFLAYDQLALILCAPDKNILLTNLRETEDRIFQRFEDYHFKRLNKILYSRGEQKEIEDFLAKKYGWRIRVPYSYQVVERSTDSNFVWIKRPDPSRSLFVYRVKENPSKINENWVINIRDSLANIYFDGDSILIEDTNVFQTSFIDKPAIKIIGIWQNHKQIIGGPFRTTVFYDQNTGYIYFIDISVVAPGKRKKPYLDQLEVITKTFQFSAKMNE